MQMRLARGGRPAVSAASGGAGVAPRASSSKMTGQRRRRTLVLTRCDNGPASGTETSEPQPTSAGAQQEEKRELGAMEKQQPPVESNWFEETREAARETKRPKSDF